MSKRLKDDIQISLMGGALFGFAIYLIMLRVAEYLWWLSIVAGLGLFAVLVAYILGYDRLVTKRYAAAEAAIGVPVKVRTMGNFLTEFGKRTGNIYGCEDRIVLVSLNKKPHVTITIHARDVESFEMPRTIQLNIQRKDGNCQVMHSADAGQLAALMKKKAWKNSK